MSAFDTHTNIITLTTTVHCTGDLLILDYLDEPMKALMTTAHLVIVTK